MNKYILIITFFLSSALLCAGGLRNIRIKNTIKVASEDVRLEDMVLNSSSLSRKEKDYVIFKSPDKGERRLTLVALAYSMQKYPKLMDLSLTGPGIITVERVKNLEQLEFIKTKITQTLAKTSPWKNWKIDVVYRGDDERKILDYPETKRVHILTFDSPGNFNKVSLRVQLFDDNDIKLGVITINPEILRETQIVVLKNSLPKGHILLKSDLETISTWTASTRMVFVDSITYCVGRELRTHIKSGGRVRNSDLLSPICVKRGDILAVYFQSEALNIKISAKALKTGRRGDSVRVRNLTSGKDIDVLLTDIKKAIIQ